MRWSLLFALALLPFAAMTIASAQDAKVFADNMRV